MHLQKEEIVKRVGIRIRELRLNKGLSIERVALEAEIDYTQLSRIELGKINTSIYHIYKISSSLSVPISDIIKPLSEKNI